MRIVILGYIIRGPYGALCWHHFQYIYGLKKLGHEVLFIEDSDDYPGFHNYSSIETAKYSGFAFIETLFQKYGLKDKWAYFDSLSGDWYGVSKSKVMEFCSTAHIVINISAVNPVREWWANIPVRVFLDTDCVFTQIRMLQEQPLMDLAKSHTCHFTLGENVGQDDCKVPTAGFTWKTTRQPVVLDLWKNQPPNPKGPWTTIMHWDSYKVVEYNDEKFGMKSAAFEEFFTLPGLVPDERFEMGIKCDEKIAARLNGYGWNVIDPLQPTKTPWTYQGFIGSSKGEWSVAKHGFVYSKCGYLSERSLNYMASGRPVVIQDTGFSKFFPTGDGLLAFSNLDEASTCISLVNENYSFHCHRAREIVEECAASDAVLTKFLKDIN